MLHMVLDGPLASSIAEMMEDRQFTQTFIYNK